MPSVVACRRYRSTPLSVSGTPVQGAANLPGRALGIEPVGIIQHLFGMYRREERHGLPHRRPRSAPDVLRQSSRDVVLPVLRRAAISVAEREVSMAVKRFGFTDYVSNEQNHGTRRQDERLQSFSYNHPT